MRAFVLEDYGRPPAAADFPEPATAAGNAAVEVVAAALTALPETQLATEYPRLVWEAPTSLGYMLQHLTTHLAYHLGQINYHRRLLDAGAR